jgi:lysophospholipase L1-like esterase
MAPVEVAVRDDVGYLPARGHESAYTAHTRKEDRMLEIRSACERCEAELPADATAWIPSRGDQRTDPEEEPTMTDPGTFQREAADPFLLKEAEAQHLLHDAPWQRLCIIGDSGAEGISEPVPGYRDLVWGQRVVAELQRVQPDMRQVNLGQRNLLAAQVRETQLQQALEFEPDLLIAFLGGNDILRPAFDAAALEAEFTAIISPFLERGVAVVTSGLFDITNSPHVAEKYRTVMSQRIAQYSELVKELAARLSLLYVDLPSNPANTEDIYSSDALHLNARGHAILATEVIRVLGGELAATGAKQATGNGRH